MITRFLKWFLNTDIVGKLYVIIALFIIVISIITVVVRTQKAREIQEKQITYQNQLSENVI